MIILDRMISAKLKIQNISPGTEILHKMNFLLKSLTSSTIKKASLLTQAKAIKQI